MCIAGEEKHCTAHNLWLYRSDENCNKTRAIACSQRLHLVNFTEILCQRISHVEEPTKYSATFKMAQGRRKKKQGISNFLIPSLPELSSNSSPQPFSVALRNHSHRHQEWMKRLGPKRKVGNSFSTLFQLQHSHFLHCRLFHRGRLLSEAAAAAQPCLPASLNPRANREWQTTMDARGTITAAG